jgi:hypothetical protein
LLLASCLHQVQDFLIEPHLQDKGQLVVGMLFKTVDNAFKIRQGYGIQPRNLHAPLEVDLDLTLDGECHVAGILHSFEWLVHELLSKATNLGLDMLDQVTKVPSELVDRHPHHIHEHGQQSWSMKMRSKWAYRV